MPSKGMGLHGRGIFGLKDYQLDFQSDFVDTYDMLGARELGKDPKYGHFTIPAKLSGTLFSPRLDFQYVASKLVKNAVQERVQSKVRSVLQKENLGKLRGLFKR